MPSPHLLCPPTLSLWQTHYPGDVRRIHSNLLESYLLKSQDGLLELPQGGWELTRATPGAGPWTVHDAYERCPVDAHGRPRSRCLLGRTYDIVLSCPGWSFDPSPFGADVRPAFAPNRKHPALTPAYEAPGVTGLFFAGTLAHAGDYRVSSGGFIHGASAVGDSGCSRLPRCGVLPPSS